MEERWSKVALCGPELTGVSINFQENLHFPAHQAHMAPTVAIGEVPT